MQSNPTFHPLKPKGREASKTESIMENCHSGDHIVKDHIHTYITTCNIEEPQQKYRLGTVRDR